MHQLLTSVCCVRSVFGSSNSLLYVGGVADIETLLQRPGQVHSHGYSGCLRNVLFDGEEVFHTAPHATAGVTDGCARSGDPSPRFRYNHDTLVPRCTRPY